jgi:hypothetical protein
VSRLRDGAFPLRLRRNFFFRVFFCVFCLCLLHSFFLRSSSSRFSSELFTFLASIFYSVLLLTEQKLCKKL